MSETMADYEDHFDDANPWNLVTKYMEEKTVLPVKVEGVVNGGVIVMIEGLRGFVPASKLSLSYIEDLETYLLKEIEVQVDTVQEEPVISDMEYVQPEPEPYMEMDENDVYELATLVYLESGTESYECQKAIASVVVHRMQNDDLTLQEVIYAKNQFSPAYLIAESEPSESTLQAVREVLQDGPTIPNYVTFFRADYYHDWSELIIPYCTIDHTYFSADVRLMD